MLEQFVKSVLSYFVSIEPMNVYVQKMPNTVKYPCYLLNKCDITTKPINSYYFMNNVHLYVRCFSNDEVDLKNRINNVVQQVFANYRKLPILNEDGSETGRYIRIEDIESIEIPVDQNDLYCVEINFGFDTTHNVSLDEFELLESFGII
jgi:hypothetical protein